MPESVIVNLVHHQGIELATLLVLQQMAQIAPSLLSFSEVLLEQNLKISFSHKLILFLSARMSDFVLALPPWLPPCILQASA